MNMAPRVQLFLLNISLYFWVRSLLFTEKMLKLNQEHWLHGLTAGMWCLCNKDLLNIRTKNIDVDTMLACFLALKVNCLADCVYDAVM